MSIWAYLKSLCLDFIRYVYKGGRIDCALEWVSEGRFGDGVSHQQPDATFLHVVSAKLLLKNNSTNPAYNIKLLNAKEIFHNIDFREKLFSLMGNESKQIDVGFIQTLLDIPVHKLNKTLTIQYENERGTKLYTKFLVAFGDPYNQYSF